MSATLMQLQQKSNKQIHKRCPDSGYPPTEGKDCVKVDMGEGVLKPDCLEAVLLYSHARIYGCMTLPFQEMTDVFF